MKRIPVAGPWITDREVEYVAEAARVGWYEHWGDFQARFEQAFRERLGVRYAMSLPSCTSAIHLAMACMGVGPGDEVIVPDVTWIASGGPATYLGATPVLADIDPVTWCVSAETVRRCITPRTKAIVVVELYGSMPDWDALQALSRETGIPILEDSAEAVGSQFHGQEAGAFGLAGVFSFHGTKTMSTGEGGMLVTNDEELFDRALQLRDQGRNPRESRKFWHEEIGFKYRMSAVQAALGLAQTERLTELVAKKREIFGWYQERLGGLAGITLNAEPEGVLNSYWMSTLLVDPAIRLSKEDMMAGFDEAGIDTRPFFYPLSSMPAFSHYMEAAIAREQNVVSYRLSPQGVNLPSALNLTEADADRVCEAFTGMLARASRS